MSVLASEQRDYAEVAQAIAARMNSARPDAAPRIVIRDLHALSGGAGFSNQTLFATLVEEDRREDIVIRVGPKDPANGLFPEYDIPRQYRVMRALEAEGTIPVPHCLWLDQEPDVFGSPYYIMRRIVGQVPADVPPITVAGFVFEASEADRTRFWWSQIDAIARLDRIDWERAELGFLWKDRTRPPIEEQIDYYERCYRWGRGDDPVLPDMEKTLRWLRAHAPQDSPTRLCWGDARVSNFMFRDFQVVAMLDWEMAHIGDPECDLAYFMFHHDLFEDYAFPEYSRPRMTGIPSNKETIAHFENLLGRRLRHFDYYTAFNAFKNLASTQRFADLCARAGLMEREHAEELKRTGGGMRGIMMAVVDG